MKFTWKHSKLESKCALTAIFCSIGAIFHFLTPQNFLEARDREIDGHVIVCTTWGDDDDNNDCESRKAWEPKYVERITDGGDDDGPTV